jgi:hypothetical protein
MTDQEWAQVILRDTDDHEVERVINAINSLTKRREARSGAVIIACAQVLSQCITQAPQGIAAEIRTGILALIDGYATRFAVIAND